MSANTDRKFPCPVCAHPLEVRLTKKDKPYVMCDPCGVQLFIRGPEGIEGFKRLIEQWDRKGLFDRLEQMERHYRLSCPDCGCRFWIGRGLVKTSAFDGSLRGFRCPKCGEIVPWEGKP